MRLLTAIIAVVGLSALFWFLTTKPIQLAREVQIPTVPAGGLVPAWRDGVVRRVDDVSFWNSFAATLAAFLMYRAWTRLSRVSASTGRFMSGAAFAGIWLAVAGTLVALYLRAVYVNNGTFWWLKDPAHTDATIAVLQFSEGIVNVILIIAATGLLPAGLSLVRAIESGLRGRPAPSDCGALLQACGALTAVVIAPFLSTLLAFGSWRFFKWWLALAGGPRIIGGGSSWKVVVIFCGVLCLQFAILGLYAWLRLRNYARPKIEVFKAAWYVILGFLIGLPAVFLFLSVSAKWKASSPCATRSGMN